MSKRLNANLRRKAIAWASQLTKLAKAIAPRHLKDLIHSTVEPQGDSNYYHIRTFVSFKPVNPKTQKGGSADAAAREFGSGIHGGGGKYPIRPKAGRKFLAFKWEIFDQNPDKFFILPDGRGLLPQVMHPGVEAANQGHGYIGPAQEDIMHRIPEELNIAVIDAIDFEMKSAFKNAKKS